jgi:hypothetical protein
MKLGTLLAAILLIVPSLFAQDSEELMRGPDGGTTYHVDGISIRPLPGQPFSNRSTSLRCRMDMRFTISAMHRTPQIKLRP